MIGTENHNDDTPYFFLVTDQYVLGTPKGMETSERTIDMPFQELAENYDLQTKLKLASAVRIKPAVMYAEPLVGSELHQAVAGFISAFANNPLERQQRRAYLNNNGLIRILVFDSKLLEEVRAVA